MGFRFLSHLSLEPAHTFKESLVFCIQYMSGAKFNFGTHQTSCYCSPRRGENIPALPRTTPECQNSIVSCRSVLFGLVFSESFSPSARPSLELLLLHYRNAYSTIATLRVIVIVVIP